MDFNSFPNILVGHRVGVILVQYVVIDIDLGLLDRHIAVGLGWQWLQGRFVQLLEGRIDEKETGKID